MLDSCHSLVSVTQLQSLLVTSCRNESIKVKLKERRQINPEAGVGIGVRLS